MKATQLSPSDLPSSEAAVQSIGEDDFTCPSPAKRYTISVEESVTRNLPCYTPGQGVGNVTGVAPQPLSTSPNPSIRHKYDYEQYQDYLCQSSYISDNHGESHIHFNHSISSATCKILGLSLRLLFCKCGLVYSRWNVYFRTSKDTKYLQNTCIIYCVYSSKG